MASVYDQGAGGHKRRAVGSAGVGLGPGGGAQRWRTRPSAVDVNGNALRDIDDSETGWDAGHGSTGLTPRAQHMQLDYEQPALDGFGHPRSHSQDAVVAHHAAARRQNDQVAAANQLIVQQNLWHAIRAGKRQMVKRAVEDDGGDPMAGDPDDTGATAIHLAAKLSKIGLLEYLLSLPGVDPGVKDTRGRTPADLATNADIRDLLAGRREEVLQPIGARPPPPPGGPSWGAASRAGKAAALANASSGEDRPLDRREAAAAAAEARSAGGDPAAAKAAPRRTRISEDDLIRPPMSSSDGDGSTEQGSGGHVAGAGDGLGVAIPGAGFGSDHPPTPVKLLGERAGLVGGAVEDGAGPGVLAAAAKSAAAAKAKPSRGPVTKDVFGGGGGAGRGSRGSGSSGPVMDDDGFPVIEGPPRAEAILGQEEFLR